MIWIGLWSLRSTTVGKWAGWNSLSFIGHNFFCSVQSVVVLVLPPQHYRLHYY